jgi:DNA-binding MarR family transcriptional regulator
MSQLGGSGDDLSADHELAGVVRFAVMRAARRLRAEGGQEGITQTQHAVLAWLRDGPSTLRVLAEREKVQAPWMTRTVAPLVAAGLVQRSPGERDRREVVVRLTEAGRDLLQRPRTQRTEWLAGQLGELDGEDKELLSKAAAILVRLTG